MQINLSAHYQGGCPNCAGINTFANIPYLEPTDVQLQELLNAVATDLHSGLNPEQINQLLYAYTSGKLTDALLYGYQAQSMDWNSPDNVMLSYLRHNIFQFSAAKSLAQQLQMAHLLIDENGKVKSLSQFKKDVNAVNILFNKKFIQTEYNHALAAAQMNSKWVEFEINKDLSPFLRYSTAGDLRVRDAHAALNNFKAPIDDKVWNTIFPPNGWNCRCNVLSTSDGSGSLTGDAAGVKIRGVVKDKLFQNNTGKSRVLFYPEHPYFLTVDQKHSPLLAERNYGLKSIEKIYVNANKFAKRAKSLNSIQELNQFWAELAAASKNTPYGAFDAKCKITGRTILFDDALKQKIALKYGKGDNRLNDVPNIFEVLKNPDEIWTTDLKGGRGRGARFNLFTVHIKYFNDEPMAVISESGDTDIRCISLYSPKSNINDLRKGILEWKK